MRQRLYSKTVVNEDLEAITNQLLTFVIGMNTIGAKERIWVLVFGEGRAKVQKWNAPSGSNSFNGLRVLVLVVGQSATIKLNPGVDVRGV